MSIFTCCEREDETKYIHPCACPLALVTCESEQINAKLCGWPVSTYATPSTPPVKYRTLTVTATGSDQRVASCYDDDGLRNYYYQTTRTPSGSTTYNAVGPDPTDESEEPLDVCRSGSSGDNSIVATAVGYTTITDDDAVNSSGCPPSEYTQTVWTAHGPNVPASTYISFPSSSWSSTCLNNAAFTPTATTCSWAIGTYNMPGQQFTDDLGNTYTNKNNLVRTYTLSNIDTVTDAEERAIKVVGTSCSSLLETRDTGFSWIKRTSGYTIECSDLAVGVEYEVIPSIRKRTAVVGSYGEWEDVTVSSISFTATATTETIDSSGNPIALDHIQGYEYEITGVNIEKKA